MASMLSDGSDGGGGVFVAVAINGQPTTFRLSSSKLKFKEEKKHAIYRYTYVW